MTTQLNSQINIKSFGEHYNFYKKVYNAKFFLSFILALQLFILKFQLIINKSLELTKKNVKPKML